MAARRRAIGAAGSTSSESASSSAAARTLRTSSSPRAPRGTCFRLPSSATATTLVLTQARTDSLGDGGSEGLVLVADRSVADAVAGQPGMPPVNIHCRRPRPADLGNGIGLQLDQPAPVVRHRQSR